MGYIFIADNGVRLPFFIGRCELRKSRQVAKIRSMGSRLSQGTFNFILVNNSNCAPPNGDFNAENRLGRTPTSHSTHSLRFIISVTWNRQYSIW